MKMTKNIYLSTICILILQVSVGFSMNPMELSKKNTEPFSEQKAIEARQRSKSEDRDASVEGNASGCQERGALSPGIAPIDSTMAQNFSCQDGKPSPTTEEKQTIVLSEMEMDSTTLNNNVIPPEAQSGTVPPNEVGQNSIEESQGSFDSVSVEKTSTEHNIPPPPAAQEQVKWLKESGLNKGYPSDIFKNIFKQSYLKSLDHAQTELCKKFFEACKKHPDTRALYPKGTFSKAWDNLLPWEQQELETIFFQSENFLNSSKNKTSPELSHLHVALKILQAGSAYENQALEKLEKIYALSQQKTNLKAAESATEQKTTVPDLENLLTKNIPDVISKLGINRDIEHYEKTVETVVELIQEHQELDQLEIEALAEPIEGATSESKLLRQSTITQVYEAKEEFEKAKIAFVLMAQRDQTPKLPTSLEKISLQKLSAEEQEIINKTAALFKKNKEELSPRELYCYAMLLRAQGLSKKAEALGSHYQYQKKECLERGETKTAENFDTAAHDVRNARFDYSRSVEKYATPIFPHFIPADIHERYARYYLIRAKEITTGTTGKTVSAEILEQVKNLTGSIDCHFQIQFDLPYRGKARAVRYRI
ncbi:MAG: hypothetical protein FJ390_06210 [Verrucomicrobia bacterium]|nr:hypothetical protein [Verrucomicrobiota bacterium]